MINPHSLLSKAIVQVMGCSLLASTTINPLMAQELSQTEAASAAKTFATSTSGLLNDFETRLDKLNNAYANIQQLHQEMLGMQKQLDKMMALMAKTQKSTIKQMAKQTRQQVDSLKAKLAEDSRFKEILNRTSQLEKGFASITKNTSHEEVQKLEKQLKQVSQELAQELRQQKEKITEAIEKECSNQADREQVSQTLSAMENDSHDNQRSVASELPSCLSPETQQKIQEYEVAQQGRDLFMQQAWSMMLMAMATGNPYIIAAVATLTVVFGIFSLFNEQGGGNGNNGGDGSGNGKQSSGRTEQTNNNVGTGNVTGQNGQASSPKNGSTSQSENVAHPKNGIDSNQTGTVSGNKTTNGYGGSLAGNGTNGGGSSSSDFGNIPNGECRITKRGDTLSFIDVNNNKNSFSINWKKINRSGDNPVPNNPNDVGSWSCDFENKLITVTYGSECRAIQLAKGKDSYDSRSNYLGGVCQQ